MCKFHVGGLAQHPLKVINVFGRDPGLPHLLKSSVQGGFVYGMDGQAWQGYRPLAAQKRGRLGADAAHIVPRLRKQHSSRQESSQGIPWDHFGYYSQTRCSGMWNQLDPCDGFAQGTVLEYAPDAIELGFQPLEWELLPCHLETRDSRPGANGASSLSVRRKFILDRGQSEGAVHPVGIGENGPDRLTRERQVVEAFKSNHALHGAWCPADSDWTFRTLSLSNFGIRGKLLTEHDYRVASRQPCFWRGRNVAGLWRTSNLSFGWRAMARLGSRRGCVNPRESIHTFKNVGEAPSRMLIETSPAGFKTFFARCAEEFAKPGGPDTQRINGIAVEHGIRFLKP